MRREEQEALAPRDLHVDVVVVVVMKRGARADGARGAYEELGEVPKPEGARRLQPQQQLVVELIEIGHLCGVE